MTFRFLNLGASRPLTASHRKNKRHAPARPGFEALEQRLVLSNGLDSDSCGPTIDRFELVNENSAIRGITLHFNEALSNATAATTADFSLVASGKDKRFGTRDDRPIAIHAVNYNATATSISLTFAAPLAPAGWHRLAIDSDAPIADVAGNRFDGDRDGIPGGNFETQFLRARKVTYLDRDRDNVSLSLKRGGTIELFVSANGTAQTLNVVDPIDGRSVLSGKIKRARQGSDGIATLMQLAGLDGVRNTLPAQFSIDSTAPVINVVSPVTGSLVNSVTLSGRVTDDLSGVAQVRAQLGANPLELPLNGAGGFSAPITLPLDGSADGVRTLRLIVSDRAGNLNVAEVTFTLDTLPPASPAFDLDALSDTAPAGDQQTTMASVTLSGTTSPQAQVTLVETGVTTTASDAGRFEFPNVTLALGANSLTIRARDAAGNSSTATRNFTRLAAPVQSTLLREEDRFVTQVTIPVELGQNQGSRLLRFDVQATFDETDQTAAIEDSLLVYLVDPSDPSQTLLDRGVVGTSLFSLAGDQAEFVPGLVRYDGTRVEIDVTSLGSQTQGLLVFQLVNSDNDDGTQVEIGPVSNLTDSGGVARGVFPLPRSESLAGPAVDLSALTTSSSVHLEIRNVRVDAASGRYTADLGLSNNGPSIGRQVAVVFPGLPDGVDLVSPSGFDTSGAPYVNFAAATPRGGLAAEAESQAITVAWTNPQLLRFALTPTILVAGANRPPLLTPVDPITVMPGDTVIRSLSATDPDGDPVTFTLQSTNELPNGSLSGSGQLSFRPTPDQVGRHQFTILASDGAATSTQNVTLDVVADANTTTRLSGIVRDSGGQPLAGVPVRLGTTATTTGSDGSFLLTFPGLLPGNALEIHGEEFVGANDYGLVAASAEGLLGHAPFSNVNNVIPRPILLTSLDTANAVFINPSADTTVTNPSIAGAALVVSAGSLVDATGTPFSGALGLTAVDLDSVPVPLPKVHAPDMAILVGAGRLTFTTPAPLTLPNRAGWAPGVLFDLVAIDPLGGSFRDVGDGRVSGDGAMVQTISGGVQSTGLHYFVPRAQRPLNPAKLVFNENTAGVEQKATQEFTSMVELHSGAIIETHELVTYRSLEQARGLKLSYDSLRADPRPIIHFGFPAVDPAALAGLDVDRLRLVAELTIQSGGFEFQVPGFADAPQFGLTGNEHFWSLPATPGEVEAALQADLSMLPSGVYEYELTLGLRLFDDAGQRLVGSATTVTGEILHVNSITSALGSGWEFSNLERIIEHTDGSVLVTSGDGEELRFGARPTPAAPYGSPPGDFTTLERLGDGTFRRTTREQTVQRYDVQGRLVSMTDRNGNVTTYGYDAQGRLTSMTDPVGLVTTLTYGSGTVDIVDPANRLTRLEVDSAGNLVRITDPDGSARAFGYDARHLLISEIDKRGFREATEYGFHGRATRGVRGDGSVVQVSPVQTRGLFPPEQTSIPFTAPAGDLDATAMQADPNGAIQQTELDQSGQTVFQSDGEGFRIEIVKRNAQNLPIIIRLADNLYSIAYDQRGNPIGISDHLSDIGPPPPDTPLVGASAGSVTELLVTDFNRDGLADIGYERNVFSGAEIRFLPSNGDGTFGPSQLFRSGFSVPGGSINPHDFDGDGEIDDEDQNLFLPRFQADLNGDGAPDTVHFVHRIEEAGDWNGDNRPDHVDRCYIVTHLLHGGGILARHRTLLVPDSPLIEFSHGLGPRFSTPCAQSAALSDVDGDGDPDLVLRTGYTDLATGEGFSGLLTVHNDGTGRFRTEKLESLFESDTSDFFNNNNFLDILSKDLDGDGDEDLVSVPAGIGTVQTLLQTGSRSYVAGPTFEVPDERSIVAVEDLDGDSRADLLLRSHTPIMLSIAFNTGAGFATPIEFPDYPGSLQAVFDIEDVNGDGFADVFLGARQGFPLPNSPPHGILAFGDPGGRFNQATQFQLGSQRLSEHFFVRLGDVDGDGDLDYIALFSGGDRGAFAIRLAGSDGAPLNGTPTRPQMEYDPVFNQPVRETDELGQERLFTIDPANGNRLSETHVVGTPGGDDDVISTYTYTGSGLVDTEENACGCSGVIDNDYDAFGRLVRRTMAAGTPEQIVWQYEYDAAGNQTAVIDPNGNRTVHEYDAMNRLIRTTESDPDSVGPLASPVWTYTFDAAGNRVAMTDPRGNVTMEEYDPLHRVVRRIDPDPDGAGPLAAPVTRMAYDPAGNLASTIDPVGNETRHRYDARNRLVETIDARGGITQFEYDESNNRTAIVDPAGNRTTFEYDGRNRLIRETDPRGESIEWEYDAVNNMTAKVDRNGRRITYAYDAIDRLTTETWVVPGAAPANVIQSSYDTRNNRRSVQDNFSRLAYTYDALNRIVTVDNAGTPGAPHVVLTYAYDGNGNVLSVTESISGSPGAVTAYAYDGLDRVTRITQTRAPASSDPVSDKRVDFTYNPLGQIDTIRRFRDLGGTQLVVSSDYDYDGLNRLVSLVHSNGTADVAFYDLAYDAASRITRIVDVDGTLNFNYDATHQLGGVDSSGAAPDETFAYDLNGNRIAGGIVTGPGNQLLSDGTFDYSYDGEGNLTRRTEIATGRVREFEWDHRNRLIRVIDRNAAGAAATQIVRYTYDAMDRRIAKSVDTNPADVVDAVLTHFVYDREDVQLDFVDPDGAGPAPATLAMRYLHGPGFDHVLAQEDFRQADPALRVLWLLPDHIGSTRDLVDNAGTVRNHIVYDAFGGIVSQSNPAFSTRYLFTGREFDAETGLYYYRARYYDPATGRFLSEDPIRFWADDLNLARYVANDPISKIDPSGMLSSVLIDYHIDVQNGKVTIITVDTPTDDLITDMFLFFFGLATSCEYVLSGKITNPIGLEQMILKNALDMDKGTIDEIESTFLFGRDSKRCSSAEWLFLAGVGLLGAGHMVNERRRRRQRPKVTERSVRSIDLVLEEMVV